MSKPVTRIVFSVLFGLLIFAGLYTTVLGAPLGANRAGAHQVSGAMVNLNHYRLTAEEQSVIGAYDTLSTHQEGGHGCGADRQNSSSED